MFKKQLPTDGNVPPVSAATTRRLKYFAAFEEPKRQNRYLWVALAISMVVILCMSISINHMQPLQRSVPYFVMSDPVIAGKVVPASLVAHEFNPSVEQKRYHIEEWVSWLWTLDPALTTDYLQRANTLTSGAATKVLKDYIAQEKIFIRMKEQPDLKRETTILDTNFIGDDVAIVRVALSERINGVRQKPYYRSMTIHYILITPKTKAESDRSPVGLTITDFAWSEARIN